MRPFISTCFIAVLCSQSAAETVRIPWNGNYSHNNPHPWTPQNLYASGWTTNFLNGTPQEGGKIQKDGTLVGEIKKPKSKGPIPFVIVLHGCTGLKPVIKWAEDAAAHFNRDGVGALLLNSFSPRNVKESCGDPDYHWAARRAEDAFSALTYLVKNGHAKADEVYIMGRSNGGRATLLALDQRMYASHVLRFTAGFAIVPNCLSHERRQYYAPLLVFAAERDDANPVKHCLTMAEISRPTPLRLIVFRNATHGYMEKWSKPYTFRGWRMQYSHQAYQQTYEAILAAINSKRYSSGIERR